MSKKDRKMGWDIEGLVESGMTGGLKPIEVNNNIKKKGKNIGCNTNSFNGNRFS